MQGKNPSIDGDQALEQAVQGGCRPCLQRCPKPDRKLKCVCEMTCLLVIEGVSKTAS